LVKRRFLAFCRFWYDFVIGDDWRLAVAVVIALGATTIASGLTDVALWWVVIVAVVVALPASIYRVARKQA
jgi:hypothetical protein